jgi:hypothetical protein
MNLFSLRVLLKRALCICTFSLFTYQFKGKREKISIPKNEYLPLTEPPLLFVFESQTANEELEQMVTV